MTLYNLTGQLFDLYQRLSEGTIDEQMFNDTLEAMDFSEEFESKVESYVCVIKQLEADEAMIKAEKERLDNRAKGCAANAKRLKEQLQQTMRVIGKDKIKTNLFSLSIQKNPHKLEFSSEEFIPKTFMVPQEPVINKKGLLDYIKAGHDVIGVTVTQGESLRIR